MIPIRHTYNIPQYDLFLEKFQKRIVLWLEGKDNRLSQAHKRLALSPIVQRRFRLFKDLTFIRWYAYTPANRLEIMITRLKLLFYWGLTSAQKEIMDNALNLVFGEWGFDEDEFPKYELVEDVGVKCCPYCNRNFAFQYKYKNYRKRIEGKAQPELDHFYAKSLYPYLAICCNNLVPSCQDCNGVHGKWNTNVRGKMISPYELSTTEDIHFGINVKSGAFLSLDNFEDGVSLVVEASGSNKQLLEENIRTFHLQELYEKHLDYAAEIYYKGRLKYNPYYLAFLEHVLNDNNMSKSEKYRLLLGVYTDEKDYGKRPLSKFCTDIAKQFGLI